jgi:hypothetical protein
VRPWLLCFPAKRTWSVSPRLIMHMHRWLGYRNSFKVILSVCVCVCWFPRPLTYSLNCIIHIPPPSGNQTAHARIDIYQLWRLKYSFIFSNRRIWFHHKLISKKSSIEYLRIYRSITSHLYGQYIFIYAYFDMIFYSSYCFISGIAYLLIVVPSVER